ncbi:MAG TPA: hypothetical protein VN238_11210 [Solirubrobacteraceae bacterium]|nr:hypothetical protein [Solirubrobacteraceae bacterium]
MHVGTDTELLHDAIDALPEPARTIARQDGVGAVVVNMRHCTASNGYFLRLVGAPTGPDALAEVPWVRLTPPEYLHVSAHGIAQARIAGASEPYEKEYELADGTRVPVLAAVGLLRDGPVPLLGLVAHTADTAACDAIRAWTSSPDRDVRPRLTR